MTTPGLFSAYSLNYRAIKCALKIIKSVFTYQNSGPTLLDWYTDATISVTR